MIFGNEFATNSRNILFCRFYRNTQIGNLCGGFCFFCRTNRKRNYSFCTVWFSRKCRKSFQRGLFTRRCSKLANRTDNSFKLRLFFVKKSGDRFGELLRSREIFRIHCKLNTRWKWLLILNRREYCHASTNIEFCATYFEFHDLHVQRTGHIENLFTNDLFTGDLNRNFRFASFLKELRKLFQSIKKIGQLRYNLFGNIFRINIVETFFHINMKTKKFTYPLKECIYIFKRFDF